MTYIFNGLLVMVCSRELPHYDDHIGCYANYKQSRCSSRKCENVAKQTLVPHTTVSVGAVTCRHRVYLCNGRNSVDVVQDFCSYFCSPARFSTLKFR